MPLGAGDQAGSSAVLHRLELPMIEGHHHLDACPGRVADDVAQVRIAGHGRFVHDDQVTGSQLDRPERPAPFLQVAEELGEVVALRYSRCGEHVASVEATARRLVGLRGPALLIALEPACRPRALREEPKLRVQWVHLSGSWPFVPRHKSVPADSLLARPLAGERVEEAATLAGLAAEPIPDVRISASLYSYTDVDGTQHDRVLALITPVRTARRHRAA
jgi:hypothetical protein